MRKPLPLNLLDALRAFEVRASLREARGWANLSCPPTSKLKTPDWNDYARQLTEWERETTLDC